MRLTVDKGAVFCPPRAKAVGVEECFGCPYIRSVRQPLDAITCKPYGLVDRLVGVFGQRHSL